MFSEIDKETDLQKKAAQLQSLVSSPNLNPEALSDYLESQFKNSQDQKWLQYCLKIKLWALQKQKIKPVVLHEPSILKELGLCDSDNSRAVLLKAHALLVTHEHLELKFWLQSHAGNGETPLGKISFWILDHLKKNAPATEALISQTSVSQKLQPVGTEDKQASSVQETSFGSSSQESNQVKVLSEPTVEKSSQRSQSSPPQKPRLPKSSIPPARKKWEGPTSFKNGSESKIKNLGWIITLFIVSCLTIPWLWLAWKLFSTILSKAV
jgi:hypothetical protein